MRREIPIPTERLAEFCRRWKITELRVFGSALREDFRPDSDLDLLVRFAPDADWNLLDHVAMEEELTSIIGLRHSRKLTLLCSLKVTHQHRGLVAHNYVGSLTMFCPT